MAKGIRVAFLTADNWQEGQPAFEETVVQFEWFSGMSWQQKQKSSLSMLETLKCEGYEPLEVSRRSTDMELGVALSAFNLQLNQYYVENIFQAYKTFNDGGPYLDLLKVSPKEAKQDCRIQTKESTRGCQRHKISYTSKQFFEDDRICSYCKSRQERYLTKFTSSKASWDIEPKSLFYDALYISALIQQPNLANQLIHYNAFTDIEFNQKVAYAQQKGPFNCQARSCAIYSTLTKAGLTKEQILEITNKPERMKQLYPQPKQHSKQETLL